MYIPKHFEQADPALCLALMQEYSFATLISNDTEGLPFVSHIPLVVSDNNGQLIIEGHVAKPNPHWKYWENNPQALVIFQGPHAYLSPKVYPDSNRVPTWNYLAVHAAGKVNLIHDEAIKDAVLKRLIAVHEPEYAEQWRSLGAEFQTKMLSGIVAFTIAVEKLEGKFKLNQHRKESHGAMKAAYQQGSPTEMELAKWMTRLGL